MSSTIDPTLLGEQVKRLITEFRDYRADFDVAAAILRRLDLTQGHVLDEVRGVHAQQERLRLRMEAMESTLNTRFDRLDALLINLKE